jgi:glycosyltransferase involved in cell wall biosynthesis
METPAPLARFSEVIVVDSASTDATPQVVRHFGAKLLQFEWNGRYPKKRNWVLLNHELSTKWVLFLDADEIVKYGNIERWWFPWIYFAYTYVAKFGFLDGPAGF